MDIYRLSSDLKFLNQIGLTLSVDERMRLELGLQKLIESHKFDQWLFWGKIEGTAKDYYIALGLNFREKFEFPEKKFYFSSNDFNFSELRELDQIDEQYAEKVDEFRGLFTGQQEKPLITVVNEEEQQENPDGENPEGQQPQDSDEEPEKKKTPKNFTEQDRLAYVVRAIENDCSLAPIGAFKLTPTHELRYNDTFKGLSLQDSSKLDNYHHFRAPQTKEKQEFIARDDALFYFNFLDPLTVDLPKGQWSVQSDSSKTHVTIRNMVWPGFVGYHRSNSRIFGYVYVGTGVKNCDLPFLL